MAQKKDIHRTDLEPQEELRSLRAQVRNLQSLLESKDKVHPLTGLHLTTVFHRKAEELLWADPRTVYCMACLDVEHFKLYNEIYGHDAGDQLLASIGATLREAAMRAGGLAGYMGGDDFMLLVPLSLDGDNEPSESLGQISGLSGTGFFIVVGAYVINDRSLSMAQICDRAHLAASAAKGSYAFRTVWYDESMHQSLLHEQALMKEAQRALAQNEFVLYAQPQCSLESGKMVSMEALVRWEHPRRGLLTPSEFIPAFEKTGFISQLDAFVWEQVCQHLRRLIDAGHRPLPVTVNVSRIDLLADGDTPEKLRNLTRRYGIEPALLSLEITETAYAENYESLRDAVSKLRAMGFRILMDDFGSGYSSLNMLQDMELDVIKLDMRFMDTANDNNARGSGILESVLRLAQWLDIRVIAEGVETDFQATFLRKIGCEYAQGYLFCKPLPIEELTLLTQVPGKVDYEDYAAPMGARARMSAFTNLLSAAMGGDSFTRLSEENRRAAALLVYQTMVGGLIGCYCEEGFPLYFANDEIVSFLGYDSYEEFSQAIQFRVINTVYEPDRPQVLGDIGTQPYPGKSYAIRYRMRKKDGSLVWIADNGRIVDSGNGRLAAVSMRLDVSREMEALAALQAANGELERQNQRLAFFNNNITGGCYQCADDDEHTIIFASPRFLDILGFTKEELEERFESKYRRLVHPEDKVRVRSCTAAAQQGVFFSMQYKMCGARGYIHVMEHTKLLQENGKGIFFGMIVDVSEQVELRADVENIVANIPGDVYRLRNGGEAIYYNAALGPALGYSNTEYRSLLHNHKSILTYPPDKAAILEHFSRALSSKSDYDFVFRSICRDGTLRHIRTKGRYVQEAESYSYYGLMMDVEPLVESQQRLARLMESTPAAIIEISFEGNESCHRVLCMGPLDQYADSVELLEAQLNQRGRLLDFVDHDVVADCGERVRLSLESGIALDMDFYARSPLGKSVWFNLKGKRLEREGEKPIFLCVLADITRLKGQERSMWLLNEQFRSVIRQAGLNIWQYDYTTRDLCLLRCGEIWRTSMPTLRCTREGDDLFINNFPACLGSGLVATPQDEDALKRAWQDLHDGGPMQAHVKLAGQNGPIRWIEVVGETICSKAGRPLRDVGYFRDITAERERHQEEWANQQLLQRLEENALYNWRINLTEDGIFRNPAGSQWLKETGNEPDMSYSQCIVNVCKTVVTPPFQKRVRHFLDRSRLLEAFDQGELSGHFEYQRRYEGAVRWCKLEYHMVRHEETGDIYGYFFVTDIEDRKQQEHILKQRAEIDCQSGLYNRQAGCELIQAALSRTLRNGDTGGLIMCDLDNFKRINDTWGHAYGDEAIADIGCLLRSTFSKNDVLCRMGGDEFLAYCPQASREEMENFVRRLCEGARKLRVGKNGVSISLSAGVVMIPSQGTDFKTLYPAVDDMLYAAKAMGKNTYCFSKG